MYGPIEEDDFSSDLDNYPASPSPSKGPSTSGHQQPTGVGQQSTIPDWDSDGSSDLEIVEVKSISSTRKLDVNSSEDEGFSQNPFKW